jgi:lactate racemase
VLDKGTGDDAVVVPLSTGIDDLLDQLDERRLVQGCRVLLVVPDHTRFCRLDEILRLLLPRLQERWQPEIEILIANGSHVLQPEETIRRLVGEEVYDSYPVYQHDSRDAQALDFWGTTRYGTPVYLNSRVKKADFIITIGGVLYHYFAGFGGGPKMLLPGVAGYETIRINHRRTVDETTASFHSQCREGQLDGNPVFMDVAEIISFLPNVLSLQVVLNRKKEPIFCQAGPLLQVHRRACQCVEQVYTMPLSQQADVVVASAGGFPADVNLIQSHKALHHAFQAVKSKGFILLLAECREGIGSATCMPFFQAGDAKAMGKRLLEGYQINGQTALALRMKAEQANIYLVSSLDEQQLAKTGIKAAGSFYQAWQVIASQLPESARGYIMPKASTFLPVLTSV